MMLVWAPRLMGLAVSLFLALFSLDAFDGRPLFDTLPASALHLLPAAIAVTLVAASWRHPLIGVFAFGIVAIGYAAWVRGRLDWILAISGPLALTAVLHALSARAYRRDPGRQRTAS